MRPIDADELMELYEDAPDIKFDMFSVPIPIIRQNIMDMKTLDPEVFIPKGEWIKQDDMTIWSEHPSSCCSNCGQVVADECVPWFKFCLNCGSKNVRYVKE